jgi:hypothetical protein
MVSHLWRPGFRNSLSVNDLWKNKKVKLFLDFCPKRHYLIYMKEIEILLEEIALMNQEIGKLKYLLDSNDIKYIMHDETDTGELEVVQVD